jgi:hypothetical protein
VEPVSQKRITVYAKYRHDGVFVSPPRDAVIWRYMDLTKFLSLLDQKALFFCRADLLGDSFEGSYPKGAAVEGDLDVGFSAAINAKEAVESIITAMSMAEERKHARLFVLVNCWHIGSHESAAMWNLYLRSGEGIAIKSTVEGLTNSLRCNEDVWIGKVDYLDYESAGLPSMDMFHAFLSKRRSFAHETELRAIIWDQERFGGRDGSARIPDEKRNDGLYAKTDLDCLINEIYVVPGAALWYTELVKSLCGKYGLTKAVKQSQLDEPCLF